MAFTNQTWLDAQRDYETEIVSFAALALRYGMVPMTLQRRAKKYGWIKFAIARTVEVKMEAEKYVAKAIVMEEKVKNYSKDVDVLMAATRQAEIIRGTTDIITAKAQEEIAKKHRKSIKTVPHEDIEGLHRLASTNKTLDNTKSSGNTVNVNQQNNTQVNVYSDMNEDDLIRALVNLRDRNVVQG
ncbi:MAG: hypothetical protein DRI24_20800 [Deltaproteobacteria bacterium]|nr:MAG: hypothetical protein DRI24_20800 [Deltaproteobacteria bacterium]